VPTAFPADLVAPEEDLLQTVYDMRPLPLQVGACCRGQGPVHAVLCMSCLPDCWPRAQAVAVAVCMRSKAKLAGCEL
jgi:hypothetical protein